ncbi:MAG TPA: XrtA system polysaccharide deacetylase [Candidatus Saccharimonadales bacterium]|nr:XrtA system polysaccharide deacetylase [Candidatus Saccharimonadales bacterium]
MQPGSRAANRPAQKHILSVDVEDYFQVEAFAGLVPRETWDQYPSRVSANCRRLLDLFERYQATATFFVMGWVADRFPELVREIHDRGHELACHSFWHRRVYHLTPDEFRRDTQSACQAIEQAASVRVQGYRAPTWSITKQSLWALEILAEEGFRYDSSIYPIHHDLYGVPGGQRFPYIHRCPSGRILQEFPPTTARVGNANIPAAGGGYLRIFPLFFTDWVFRQYEQCGKPLVVYLHPWEIDPEQPRMAAGFRSRFRHYTNLHRTQERLETLLQRYAFESFSSHLAGHPLGMESDAGKLNEDREALHA